MSRPLVQDVTHTLEYDDDSAISCFPMRGVAGCSGATQIHEATRVEGESLGLSGILKRQGDGSGDVGPVGTMGERA